MSSKNIAKMTKKMKPTEVPTADAEFLKLNHKKKSVPEMAKALKRANVTVYAYMTALGLEPKARVITRAHPFRVQNKKLETMLTGYRIANSNRQNSANE